MSYTITIKLADDSTKEIIISSDVEIPSGLNVTPTQLASLMNALNSLTRLIDAESWKSIEIEVN